MPERKIRKILLNIKSHQDKLKEIKQRINDDYISYDEINCVLANIRGKHTKKNISYFAGWYQRTNCFRKCYLNKKQREECRINFQKLIAKSSDLMFTKKEFIVFFNNHISICTLPDYMKRKNVSWREFRIRLAGYFGKH